MNKPFSVLIIEDDTWFAQQQTRILETAGFIVRHAVDGLAGIEAIDTSTPDAVILDIFLPGPNALVLLHEMQSHADLASIPVVICTNSVAVLPQTSLTAYGVKAVLDKATMRPHDLVAAIKRELI